MADKWRISYNIEIQPDLQAHCQSPKSQRFVKELAKPTRCQKDNAAKMRDKLMIDKKKASW